MQKSKSILQICDKGHKFYKITGWPACPICEEERKPKNSFLSNISAPARSALENNAISTMEQLANYSEKEILNFHGMGKSTIPILKKALKEQRLTFKDH